MKHVLGSLAKDRETQVIEWVMEHPDASFSGDGVCMELFARIVSQTAFPTNYWKPTGWRARIYGENKS